MRFTVEAGVRLGGRYVLGERIAAGGQGEVWHATDTVLDRPVAVKILRGEYAGSAEFRERFRLEARHSAGLSHPAVAQVFDYDDGDGDAPPYLVMEFVAGEPLSAMIAREAPLPADRVLQVVATAAAGLGAAHAAGLVHRDVKPGNLLTGANGSIKITDFGIARAVDAMPLTRTGQVMGTPLYLAPEQAIGIAATGATDLYALGVIAFEMLTGRPPYEGPAAAVVLAHRDAPLPPLPASVPPGLAALVGALTAKDPEARPPAASAVADWATRLRTDPTAGLRTEPVASEEAGPDRSHGAGGPSVGAQTGDGRASVPWVVAGAAATRTDGTTALGTAPHTVYDAVPRTGGYGNHTQVLDVPIAEEPVRRRALPFVVGGVAVALVAGLAGLILDSSNDSTPPPAPAAPKVTLSPRRTSHPPTITHRLPGVRRRQPVRHPRGHLPKPPKHGHKPKDHH